MSDAARLAALQAESYARAGSGLRSSWPPADALDEAGIAALLERRYAVLATARPDGRAHATPIAFTLADGAFWIGTVEGRRLRNLRARPWASLVVMEGDRDADEDESFGPPHRALTAEGRVTLHEGGAMERALGPLLDAWIARHGHPPDWAVALIELRPERVFSYGAV